MDLILILKNSKSYSNNKKKTQLLQSHCIIYFATPSCLFVWHLCLNDPSTPLKPPKRRTFVQMNGGGAVGGEWGGGRARSTACQLPACVYLPDKGKREASRQLATFETKRIKQTKGKKNPQQLFVITQWGAGARARCTGAEDERTREATTGGPVEGDVDLGGGLSLRQVGSGPLAGSQVGCQMLRVVVGRGTWVWGGSLIKDFDCTKSS